MTRDPRDPWHWFAACKGLAPAFDAAEYATPGARNRQQIAAESERIHRARLICGRCPVTADCLADFRLGRDEGIRAGQVLPSVNWKQKKKAGEVAA